MNIEKFTINASQRIQEAQSIANINNHSVITEIHLLYAMITSTDSIINDILENKKNNLLIEIDKKIKWINKVTWNIQLSISNTLNSVFLESEKISNELKDSYITEEHLFLAIIEKSDELRSLFDNLWITYKLIKEKIITMRNWSTVNDNNFETKLNTLKKYGVDLTEKAAKWKIDPVIWREQEIRRTIEILSRRTKNNPVLVWEPWVWKTAIVEWIAKKIIDGDIPDNLKWKKIVTLDMWALLAWAKYKWEFEERFKGVISEVEKSNWNIILFIDEIHTIVWAWNQEWQADAWNLLKPSLARGELHLIGATTINEYRKYIEKDAALERRFSNVLVDEPNREDSLAILRWIKDKYEKHHWVQITDDAIEKAVDLSIKYINDRQLPDKAIDLMDEAMSSVKLNSISKPMELDIIEKDIRTLKIELEALKNEEQNDKIQKRMVDIEKSIASKKEQSLKIETEWQKEKESFSKSKEIISQIDDLKIKAEKLERDWEFWEVAKIRYGMIPELEKSLTELNKLKSDNKKYIKDKVSGEDIAKVITKWTWIPIDKLLETEKEKLLQLEDRLKERVIWQDNALITISDAIRRWRSWLSDDNRPLWSFLFLWPTWVWKTETAKALANSLFNDEKAMIRIDMSEYMEKHTVSRLIWSPPWYIWHDEGWQLTEAIRRKPYSVILFDEVEKAHPDVFNILLQVLDDGILTDSKWRTVNFKNSIIILTSNIWSKKIQEMISENKSFDDIEKEVHSELKLFFRPEFLNRLDDVILFNSITNNLLSDIMDKLLNEVILKLKKQDINMSYSNELKQYLIDIWFDIEYGARPLKRIIQKEIINMLSKEILANNIKLLDNIYLDIEHEKIKIIKK